MADIPGCGFDLPSSFGSEKKAGLLGMWSSLVGGQPGRVVFRYYRMRGWNTALVAWEFWTAADAPDPVPPIGPCTDVAVVSSWEGA